MDEWRLVFSFCNTRRLWFSTFIMCLLSLVYICYVMSLSKTYQRSTTHNPVLQRLFAGHENERKLVNLRNISFHYKRLKFENTTINKNSLYMVQQNLPLKRPSNMKTKLLLESVVKVKEIETSKIVLFWYLPFEDYSMILEFLHESSGVSLSQNGEIAVDSPLCGNCKFISDRRLINTSDAIVFHLPQIDQFDLPPPKSRRQKQLYVWWAAESSATSQFNDFVLDYFNFTMSVRRSSDVFSPYGSLSWILKMLWSKGKGKDVIKRLGKVKQVMMTRPSMVKEALLSVPVSSFATRFTMTRNVSPKFRGLIERKKGLVAWIVSNCGYTESSYLRLSYADLLKNGGLEIDQFGSCSDTQFPISSRWDPAFYEVLSRYKFYLAFENSYHCQDYITEKLWLNSLYSGVVPVIFGPHKRDVESMLPPNSFIHAADFKNPLSLIRYLHYLDKNVTAYAEYLKWRNWVKFLDENGEFHWTSFKKKEAYRNLSVEEQRFLEKYARTLPLGFCHLCKKLSSRDYGSHSIQDDGIHLVHDINSWWERKERDECLDSELAWTMSRL